MDRLHLYLSPHLDDATLSCGGTIHAQASRGERVRVLTLFAGSPDEASPTAYAEELRTRWGGAHDPVAERRREDRQAMQILGATFEHLDLLDCVYRVDAHDGQSLYATEVSIFEEIHPREREWHQDLALALQKQTDLGGANIYAPLTVGHHVDHQIVHRMARLLARSGHNVLYYEDFPYAGDAEAVQQALAQCDAASWTSQVRVLSAEDIAAKCAAIAAYRSQLSTFWSNDDEMHQFVRQQALDAKGRLVERFWHVAETCR